MDAHVLGPLDGVRVIDRIHAADVLITHMRHRAPARLGLTYDDLAAANPGLVHAHTAGFRGDSDRADAAALAGTVQAACDGNPAGVGRRTRGHDRLRRAPRPEVDAANGS